jgi:hypothetical protein
MAFITDERSHELRMFVHTEIPVKVTVARGAPRTRNLSFGGYGLDL